MVLDASAVLALVQDEPGADLVERELGGALLCAVNLAEVVGKLVDADLDPRQLAPLLRAAGVMVEPLTERDAELAGALRGVAGAALCPWVTGAACPWRCATRRARSSPRTTPGRRSTCR